MNNNHNAILHSYRNQQQLSKKKVLQFTKFHSNVGKTLAGLALSVINALKKAIAQTIY